MCILQTIMTEYFVVTILKQFTMTTFMFQIPSLSISNIRYILKTACYKYRIWFSQSWNIHSWFKLWLLNLISMKICDKCEMIIMNDMIPKCPNCKNVLPIHIFDEVELWLLVSACVLNQCFLFVVIHVFLNVNILLE